MLLYFVVWCAQQLETLIYCKEVEGELRATVAPDCSVLGNYPALSAIHSHLITVPTIKAFLSSDRRLPIGDDVYVQAWRTCPNHRVVAAVLGKRCCCLFIVPWPLLTVRAVYCMIVVVRYAKDVHTVLSRVPVPVAPAATPDEALVAKLPRSA